LKLRKLEWAVVTLTAVLLALMAGWTLGKRHSREILRQSAPSPSSQALDASPVPEKPGVEFPININTASEEDLTALPGIGETRARSIVEWRRKHGRFQSAADLLQVPGIGEATLEGLLDYITVGG